MKTRLLLLATLITFAYSNSFSQTVIYSEDFDGALTWTLNTDIGVEGALPNNWYISCFEDGLPIGACGTACATVNNTLHLGANPGLGDTGAAYAEAGAGTTTTDRRAESANISTVGQTNLTLNFDFIGNGGNPQDYSELFYSIDGGGTWISLSTPLVSLCCGGVLCAGGQGLWENFSIALPVACENIANLRISFVWKNLDDLIATDPSLAINDLEITTPSVGGPTADFTASLTTICEGDCIDFTDASTFGTNPIWAWSFTGAATATSALQDPTGICYPTAGTFQVELVLTDDAGNDTETKVGYITVNAAANPGTSTAQNLCNNATLDLNTLIPGADAGVWLETSGTPSGQFTVGTGVLDGNGLPIGNVYTFDYTVTGVPPCANATSTMTITIIDCSGGTPPVADFSTPITTICEGDCIDFTDLSTLGTNPTWAWSFTGAATLTSAIQNPTNICYPTAGTFQVELVVTDDIGTDTETKVGYITVNASPVVTITATPNGPLCTGDPVTLTAAGATTYVWDNGVTDGVAFNPASTTTYTVIGTDGNGCEGTQVVTITVVTCDSVSAGWTVVNTNICLGDCITFSDTSTGTITSWAWDFGLGGTPNTSTLPDPTICFDTTGTFTVELTVTGGINSSSSQQVISVFAAPTVAATLDTLIDLGGQADLISIGGGPGSYLWTPPYNLDCDTCNVTWASPYLDTDYIVIFTDLNGCSAEDTVTVTVNFIEGIDVPSAFSPNGDDNNDVLYVKGIGIENMTFAVYNRYGQLVFKGDHQGLGWDGTFKGRDENSGVFTWVLDYTLVNGSQGVLKGNTTLIR